MPRKTRSLWGPAPSRFYSLLRRVRPADAHAASVAVLGCADGKFVLPAARRGFHVYAVDIDEVALYGGQMKTTDGRMIDMPGLAARLKTEKLEDLVEVVCGDLADVRLPPCDLVFTSGALQYSYNLKHRLIDIMAHLRSMVSPGGLLAIEYMLPVKPGYAGLDNYPAADRWPDFFPAPQWNVLSERVDAPGAETRPGASQIGTHQYVQWGYIIARHTAGENITGRKGTSGS